MAHGPRPALYDRSLSLLRDICPACSLFSVAISAALLLLLLLSCDSPALGIGKLAKKMESATTMDMKVAELLKEVQLDYSASLTKLVADTVSAIKKSIDSIPDNLKVKADEAPGFLRDIGVDKVAFKFKKPKHIQVCGSYAIQCIARPDVHVDLLIPLPKKCFHEKDFLNHLYHAKRFLYLCIIKKYLILSPSIEKVEWSTLQNEARKPILVVHPAMKLEGVPGISVRIIPAATSLFSMSDFNLDSSNIDSLKQEGSGPQTSWKYNSSILEDMCLEEKAEFIKTTFSGWKALGEALVLLKVWARQRSTIYGYDCVNGFLLSVLVAYLASESGLKSINNSMKPMQIFRITLEFIATSKNWETGIYFKPQGPQSIPNKTRKRFAQAFPVVLSDPSAPFNILFRVTRNAFQELQEEAGLTLDCMNKCRDGGFEKIFMTKIDFPSRYDYYMRLDIKGKSEIYSSGFCLDDECWRSYEDKVHSVLCQGLGDRAKFIRVNWRNASMACNIESGLKMLDEEPLLVGISVSSVENAFRRVDIGPSAENKEEALKFRKFWGEKAELRRFMDGVIAESTVWETNQWERHLIIKMISESILLRHLSLLSENVTHIVDQLDFCLSYGVKSQDPISFTRSLLEAFEELSNGLRSLEDIPLRVSSVLPLDSAFRFTSVYPPEPHPLINKKGVALSLQRLPSTCIQPLSVLIQLEGSGNWPMDEVAIEKTKSAFLLKIGESLENSKGMTCSATENNVDVLVSGYAFRLKILHERGLSLLNKQGGTDQMKRVSSEDRKLFSYSQHSSMINGLQGLYPLYGPVVRLAKRWVASHLFSSCLVEEAVELLVAHIFLCPLPFNTPCSRISGFLRFLRLLSDYDWTFSPLVVDINNDLSPQDERLITEKFTLSRKAFEDNVKNVKPAMFLATAYDMASEAWTGVSPNPLELRRLVAYARSSVELLTKLVLQGQVGSYRWECLFRTPLNNYDAVVLLHREKLPYPQHLLFPSEMNLGKQVASGRATKVFHPLLSLADVKNLSELKDKLMVDFNPLKSFIVDLESEFPGTFRIWYDSLGGDAIGLTWGKTQSKKRGRDEVEEETRDVIAVLKGVADIGKGFVKSVHCIKTPRLTN